MLTLFSLRTCRIVRSGRDHFQFFHKLSYKNVTWLAMRKSRDKCRAVQLCVVAGEGLWGRVAGPRGADGQVRLPAAGGLLRVRVPAQLHPHPRHPRQHPQLRARPQRQRPTHPLHIPTGYHPQQNTPHAPIHTPLPSPSH